MNPSTRNSRRGEEGIALIYVAVFLLVSLWFVSLAIDVGKIMAARTELQAAADAAALAGASALDPLTLEVIPTEAKARASAVASSNHAYEGVTTSVVIDPDVDVEFPAIRQVKVSVYRDADHGDPVLLHFAQALGIPSIGVKADATAEVAPLTTICKGLAPFAPEQLPGGADFDKTCGVTYLLTLGPGSSNTGNFQLLDFPECPENNFTGGGGSAVREYTEKGWNCCLDMSSTVTVDTKPGLTGGPLVQGLKARWIADSDTRENICYQQYTGNQSRVFLCPIIKDFQVNGKSEVEIVKFAAFFLVDKPSGSLVNTGIRGQFIDYVAPGFVGTEPPTSTDVFGVHLIE